MVLNIHISALSGVHETLTSALAELEKLGEFTAAAHLSAALDVIEDGIDAQKVEDGFDGNAPHSSSAIAIIARQMREVFGEGAEAVARRQLTAASGPSLMAWAAIVNGIVA
jgi:hypothetical protein